MEQIPEWSMLEKLMEVHDELTEKAEDFILELYANLDPYEPFRDQLIGLPESVDKQEKWFNRLYRQHVELEELEDWDDDEDFF